MNEMWERQSSLWRDSAEVVTQWGDASSVDPRLLRHEVSGSWWDLLERLGITLLVTREYEHLAVSVSVSDARPLVRFLPVPHPSGLVVDRPRRMAYLASTRNPNQIYDLAPVRGLLDRPDVQRDGDEGHPLVPLKSRFLPGALYLHDLAIVGGKLHGNAAGTNAVMEFHDDGRYNVVWWPKCVEQSGGHPLLSRNHLQLNSIAAGAHLSSSYFTASSDRIAKRRPGHRNFPVDGRGVVFDGRSRDVFIRGLTRPHSARLHEGRVWLGNSGYGELVVGLREGERYEVAARLPGWTRGLCFVEGVAFVGTSRVIPRFRNYAPGLNLEESKCGVHAVDVVSGAMLGSLVWPAGNQVFAIDWLPSSVTCGFPFAVQSRRSLRRERNLFYAFTTDRDFHSLEKTHVL